MIENDHPQDLRDDGWQVPDFAVESFAPRQSKYAVCANYTNPFSRMLQ